MTDDDNDARTTKALEWLFWMWVAVVVGAGSIMLWGVI